MEQGGWIKLHRRLLNDTKARQLSDREWRVFVSLLMLASNEEGRAGEVIYMDTGRPLSLTDIGSHMGLSRLAVKRAVDRLIELGMVERTQQPKGRFPGKLKVRNWARYQASVSPEKHKARSVSPRKQDKACVSVRGVSHETQAETQPPAEPQECASAEAPREVREVTSTPSATNAVAGKLLEVEPTPEPKAETKPANSARAQLVQDLWEALEFSGSPPSKKPAAFSGAMRLIDGKGGAVKELLAHFGETPHIPDDGDSEAGYFLACLKEHLACPEGVGWRKRDNGPDTSNLTGHDLLRALAEIDPPDWAFPQFWTDAAVNRVATHERYDALPERMDVLISADIYHRIQGIRAEREGDRGS